MKRVICLIGLPGSGKSTAADFLTKTLGARSFHLPAIVGHLVPAEERERARRYAYLLTGVESLFLDEVDKATEKVVILDGFLRSVPRIHLLQQAARDKDWSIEVIYLHLPGLSGTLRSTFRQARRDIGNGKEAYRIFWKLRRDLTATPAVLEELCRLNVPLRVVDATKGEKEVREQIRQQMGLDLQLQSWDRQTLQTLASIAPDAWVTGGGHVYRPFFDNCFGPPTDSWDVDIRVWGEARADEVQQKLNKLAPQRRWHVKDALSWSRKELGYEVSSVEESLGRMALICICVGIRWSGKEVEVKWGHPEAEAELRQGLLRPNAQGQLNFAEAKARKIISYYPAVSAPFLGYSPAKIALTYSEAMTDVQLSERGRIREHKELKPAQQSIADEILKLRSSLDKAPRRVFWPAPAPFPESDPWSDEDRRFRMWVVNQTRSRNPVGGRDSYLENALRLQTGIAQKPTHQGWSLHMHALHALLELETDHLPAYRRPLRMAMLWHDVGKLWNVNTPGAHAQIGSKKWLELQGNRLAGISEEEEALVSHFIASHDFFGRLERTLWDESFRGKMTPEDVCRSVESPLMSRETGIQVAKAMWLADVGSVPLLRWLRPLADLLEDLIVNASGSLPA